MSVALERLASLLLKYKVLRQACVPTCQLGIANFLILQLKWQALSQTNFAYPSELQDLLR